MTESSTLQTPPELLKAQKLANLLDTAVRIPVIGLKLGLDFVFGLIPVVGDIAMLLLSWRIIRQGKKMGMPQPLINKMIRNAGMDMVLGFIPIVGDVADIFFKANRANVRLMERWWLSENQTAIKQNTQQQLNEWEPHH